MPQPLVLRAYLEMRRLRLLDARMVVLQRQGRVGFYGACTGQEAVPIATALALAADGWRVVRAQRGGDDPELSSEGVECVRLDREEPGAIEKAIGAGVAALRAQSW